MESFLIRPKGWEGDGNAKTFQCCDSSMCKGTVADKNLQVLAELEKGHPGRKWVGGSLAMVRVNLGWDCGTRQGPEHGSGMAFDSYSS